MTKMESKVTPSGFLNGAAGVAWYLQCSKVTACRKIKRFRLTPYPEPGNHKLVRYKVVEVYQKIIIGKKNG